MSTEIKVPQLPESVSDATLVSWHKKEGDRVERDENLVDIETDKVVLEVPAPVAGILGKIAIADGTTVKGGQVIGSIAEGGAGEATDDGSEEDRSKGEGSSEGERSSGDEPREDAADEGGSGKLSPSVRRLLDEHDLDASDIEGTGRHGRLTKADVEKHLKKQGDAKDKPKEDSESFAPHRRRSHGDQADREDRRVPMTRMRSRIAERMVEAQSTAAMLTSFNEADMSAIMALRARYKEPFEKRHGVKLGFMSFFVKAACEALKRHPVVNASLDGSDVVYHDYYDIGIAVSVPKGLVVPIIRDADQLDFAGIEKTISELAGKGRDGSLTMDDLTGGTFTITNGGVFGSLVSTPILNMPQSAILGMHKIQERPVAIDGEVVIRPMMYLALTYDHRIIDGKDAVQFLVAIKDCLEDPARIAIGI